MKKIILFLLGILIISSVYGQWDPNNIPDDGICESDYQNYLKSTKYYENTAYQWYYCVGDDIYASDGYSEWLVKSCNYPQSCGYQGSDLAFCDYDQTYFCEGDSYFDNCEFPSGGKQFCGDDNNLYIGYCDYQYLFDECESCSIDSDGIGHCTKPWNPPEFWCASADGNTCYNANECNQGDYQYNSKSECIDGAIDRQIELEPWCLSDMTSDGRNLWNCEKRQCNPGEPQFSSREACVDALNDKSGINFDLGYDGSVADNVKWIMILAIGGVLFLYLAPLLQPLVAIVRRILFAILGRI